MQELDAEQALRRAGAGAVLSHEPAALAWGLELVEDGARRLTVPRSRSRKAVPGWTVVRSDLPAGSVEEMAGLPTTSLLRTVQDLCRVLTFVHAVVAADSTVRLGLLDVQELRAELGRAFGRSCSRLRAVGSAVDPLSGSVLETLLRLLLADLGPVSQHVVRDRDNRFVARVDLCWPAARLVVEADGFAFHSDRVAYRRDRERLNDLERLGWRVLRFTWEDVVARPEHVLALVQECLAQPAA